MKSIPLVISVINSPAYIKQNPTQTHIMNIILVRFDVTSDILVKIKTLPVF